MRRLAAGLIASLALIAPAAASAADQSVTFSTSEFNLPEFTTVQDQWAGSPYLVRFGSATRFGFPAPPDILNCSSPYLRDNALSGRALGIDCRSGSNEFPDRRFATAMEFQNEQRRIEFKIKNNTGHTQTAITKFYGIGSSTPFTTLTHVLVSGATTTVAYDRGSNAIVGAVVQGFEAMDYTDSGGVFIDDLLMTRDAQAPAPKFTLALQQPSAEVVEGSSVDVPVSVRRYNGSSGSVTLSVGSLPAGIASTQWLPDAAVTGSNPATLRITASSPFTATRQLAVSAVSGGLAGTGVNVTNLQQSVTGIPSLYFATGGRFPIRLVPGCGPQKITDSFSNRGPFSSYTSYNFGGTTGTSGLTSMTTGSPVYPSGPGTYPIEYTLDPGSKDGSGTFKVVLDPFGASDAEISLNWLTDRLTIDDVPNSSPALPLREGGSTVRVLGNFPLNCPVKFLDSLDQEWTVRQRDQTEVNGKLLDDLTLNLPATAVQGELRAVNGGGVEIARSKWIDVREYRRSYGFIVSNSTEAGSKGTYSWDDFERTFGTDDTDACFIVCVHDPIASDYYDKFKASVEEGKGLCYGWATMSARFRGYGTGQKFSDYQAGATRAWDITAFQEGTLGKRDVVRWYVAQFDKSMQADAERAKSRSYAAERTLLKDLLAQQGAANLGIRQGESGHAITAYGVRDTGDGGMIISVYDSNIPYQRFEESDKTTRQNALNNSEVTVGPDGKWTYPGLGWKGDNSTLTVKSNIPPLNANLPNNFSLASVFSSTNAESPAEVTAIEAAGKPQLDSDGEPIDGAGVDVIAEESGDGEAPFYQLQKGRSYELTVRGTGKGSYDTSLLTTSATASVRSVDTVKGQIDRLTIRPGESALEFATGASRSSVTYDLKEQSGKVTRTAAITTTAREGSSDTAELNGGTLRVGHDGAPAKVAITLGSVSAGLPSNGRTPAMTIGRGQRLDIRPGSWSSLTGSARYTLRAKNGRVIRRGKVNMRGGGAVALGKVRAKRSGGKLTISGTVARRGSAPALVAVATVVKGGKTIRRRSAKLSGASVKKGRFTLPVNVGKVPRGARIKIDVVLTDPTGGGATARKKVSVR